MSAEPKVGYMCKVAFDWELGEALGGVTIYPSIKDLKKQVKCWKQCGIQKVLVISLSVVVKENFKSTKKKVKNAKA